MSARLLRSCLHWVLLLAFALPIALPAHADVLTKLVPRPQQATLRDGAWSWNDATVVVVEAGVPEDAFAAQMLVGACKARGLVAPRVLATANARDGLAPHRIVIGRSDRNGPARAAADATGLEHGDPKGLDGYSLDVSRERIVVLGDTAAGTYYGVQTLIQLLPSSEEAHIPAMRIRDWTKIALRSITMDLYSGEVYDVAAFEATIRRMGAYKLNQLILYLEDAFLFPSHPAIGEDRDRLTTAQVQALSAYARKHHVDIAPSYDTPAHMSRTLRHPKYAHLAESDEGSVLNVTHPDAYPFLADLFADLGAAFPSPYNYVSADEIFGLGMGKSFEKAKVVGKRGLYLKHVMFLYTLLREQGKTMFLSADPFEPAYTSRFGPLGSVGIETLEEIPRDVIIGSWHYDVVREYPFGEQLQALGFRQMLTTANGSTLRIFPNQYLASRNVESFVPYAHRLGAFGVIHADWNRWGRNTFFEYSWPMLAHFAEWAWTDSGRKWPTLAPIAVESFYGPGTAGIAETLLFLAKLHTYFGWGRRGLSAPDFKLLFAPVVPRALGPGQRAKLEAFRRDWQAASRALEQGRGAARLNRDHLDFIRFALDEQRLLADLVEARHELALPASAPAPGASEAKAARAALVDRLTKLAADCRAITERYAALWLRVDMPLGLEPNLKRFEELQASIDVALSAARGG